jgi:hypothetical protein
MRLTIRFLGTEVFHIDTDPDEDDDKQRDLSGGNLEGRPLDVGPTDTVMGFTNGREVED